MTYPARLYDGDAGEALATIRRDGAPPDVTYANGSTTEYLAMGASTGGLFGLYRWTMSPTAGGAGPHFHRTLAESFFAPGAPREAYFEGLARWGYEGRPSDDEAADFLRRHDNILA
jgi:hypothetical protein